MHFRILGPLEVARGDGPIPLGGRKQRALLARLLIDVGRTVSVDRLIDDLWGERAPASAAKMVQIQVSQLRKVLPEGTLRTRPPGYALEPGECVLDADEFVRLRDEGRERLAGGDAGTAAARLRDALALWRGSPLAELDEPFARLERARLEELRLVCLEDRIDADLAGSRHADLVAELERLVAEHPLRERLRGQLMRALYGAGRHADALTTYGDLRRSLDEELGLVPSADLAALEQRILTHDPALTDAAPSAPGRDGSSAAHGHVRILTTVLFTDIVDSTRRAASLGDRRWHELLAAHHTEVRARLLAFGGHEAKILGDGFLATFEGPTPAILCADAIRQALRPLGLQVRAGVHTGECELLDGDLTGIAVHIGARIGALAGPDEILVSDTVRALVSGSDMVFEDRGPHALQGVREDVRVLALTGLAGEEPGAADPGGSVDPRRPSAPAAPDGPVGAAPPPLPLGAFVGRETELSELCELLERDHVRLVTLLGPGGVGKSRLALELAARAGDRFRDGVHFVSLAALEDPALVAPTIAHSLGLGAEREALEALASELTGRTLLLVLDNFEQVALAAADVARLLESTPGPTVLVTSRVPLRIRGEHAWAVPVLSIGEEDAPASEADAVRLFAARAAEADRDFRLTTETAAVVRDLCGRLDGLPLAIELAASRVRMLGPRALLERLTSRIDGLAAGPDLPARQRTLRATIDWSHELLDEPARALLARLAVFHGGATLEAAEAVCQASGEDDLLDALDTLVTHSLVVLDEDPDGTVRFRLLETIREYALERLRERDGEERFAAVHAGWVIRLAADTADGLRGADEAAASARLEADLANLRAAVEWLLAHERADDVVRIIVDVWPFLWLRGHQEERWMQRVAEAGTERLDPALHAAALACAAMAAFARGGHEDQAAHLARAAVAAARPGDDDVHAAYAVTVLGMVDAGRGEYERAIAQIGSAVERFEQAGRAWDALNARIWLERAERAAGRADVSRLRETASSARGSSPHLLAVALANLGAAEAADGELDAARASLLESLRLGDSLGMPPVRASALAGLAGVLLAEGEARDASVLLGAADAMLRRIDQAPWESDRRRHEQLVARVQAALGAEAFGAARRHGEELPVGAAVAYALAAPGLTSSASAR